jgi:transposase
MESLAQKQKTVKIFCGIDLHDQEMLAGVAVADGPITYSRLTTDQSGVEKLKGWLEELVRDYGAEAVVAYEASGAGFALSDDLGASGYRVWVLAPSHLPMSRKSRVSKTDRRDVDRILGVMRAHVLAGCNLPSVWIPPAGVRSDREVVRHRLNLGDDRTRVKNRIHGFLKRHGLRRPAGMRCWTRAHRSWLLETASQLAEGEGLLSLVRQLQFYEHEIREATRSVRKLASSDRYRGKVSAMTQLKGVGLLTAMVCLTELGDLGRFGNRRELGNYLGLTPKSYESGEGSDRKGHISRMGPARLRKVLNQAAWSVVRFDPEWREWFSSRVRLGGKKSKKKWITAVMRKLGIWLWHQGLAAA